MQLLCHIVGWLLCRIVGEGAVVLCHHRVSDGLFISSPLLAKQAIVMILKKTDWNYLANGKMYPTVQHLHVVLCKDVPDKVRQVVEGC